MLDKKELNRLCILTLIIFFILSPFFLFEKSLAQTRVKESSHPRLTTKVKKVLNWNYQIKLKEGLKRTYDWIDTEIKKEGSNLSRFTKS